MAGFTLAEALAALAFLAIVIPVAVEGLRIGNLAGQVADRKAAAALVADRLLNEMVVTGQAQRSSSTGGALQEGMREYRWQLRTENWIESNLKLVTVQVTYTVQGQDYDVQLSTVVDSSAQQ